VAILVGTVVLVAAGGALVTFVRPAQAGSQHRAVSTAATAAAREVDMTGVIPILLYHSVTDDPALAIRGFETPPATFARHLDRLVGGGFTSLTVTELAGHLRAGGAGMPSRPVVITFDDGWADFAGAAEALAQRELLATLYVTTGWLDRPGFLSAAQLPSLPSLGVEIGAHSHTHPQLDTLRARRLRQEITEPRRRLEEVLQRAVPSFAYPHGYSSVQVRRTVREAGYTSAAAVKNALSSAGDDVFDLARLTVLPTTSDEDLDRWLAGTGAPVAPYRERLRTKGWRIARRGRSRLRLPIATPSPR
jgi:peptidoglycan/xylan/chitin deacetylase (PgdA/CDA1 family)